MRSISVVIPTLNEEANIGRLLRALGGQTRRAAEVIVVDGGSSDGTAEIVARADGVRLLRGAPPVGAQRDLGLRAASGDVVVFLDADVTPGERFLERAVGAMERRGLKVAAPWYRAEGASWAVRAVYGYFDVVFAALQWVLPSGGGMGILVEREHALRVGGFRGELTYEDIEFIRRAGRRGRFGTLGVALGVSDRRFRTEGVLPLLLKYLYLSFFFTFGLFRAANSVGYRFSHYGRDEVEYVTLVDDEDREIGRARKSEVHTGETPLHRAFSVFLFNPRGEVLLQQRSCGKKTWPCWWSNSCCGHPAPGEGYEEAARRRLREELGISEAEMRCALPDYRYRAELDGIVENEICPVFVGVTEQEPEPHVDEVEAVRWEEWGDFLRRVRGEPEGFSPWCREEAELLEARDGVPEARGVTGISAGPG